MNKQIFAVFALVIGSVSASFAAPSVTVSEMVKSRYMGGNGVYFSDGPVIQSDLFMSFDNGAWVDLWNSQDLGSEEVGSYANEIDIGAGWAGKIGQSGLSLNAGIYYWDTAKVLSLADGDIWQAFAQVSGAPVVIENITIVPYAKVETLRDNGNGDLVNFESKYHLGGSVVTEKIDSRVSFSGNCDIVYDPGIFGVDPGFFLGYDFNVNVEITKSITLVPISAKVVVELGNGDVSVVPGAGLVVNF